MFLTYRFTTEMELVPECRQGILQKLLHICSVFPLTPELNDNICVLFEVFHICTYLEFCIILVSDISNFPLLRSAPFLWRETCGMTTVWAPARSQWISDNSESAESPWKHTVLLMHWLFLSSDLLMVKLAWLLAACWMVKLTVLSMYVCVPLTQWLMRLTSHITQKTTQVSMTTPALLFLHTQSLLFHTEGLLNPCLFFFSAELIYSCRFITDYFPSPVCHHSHKQNSLKQVTAFILCNLAMKLSRNH